MSKMSKFFGDHFEEITKKSLVRHLTLVSQGRRHHTRIELGTRRERRFVTVSLNTGVNQTMRGRDFRSFLTEKDRVVQLDLYAVRIVEDFDDLDPDVIRLSHFPKGWQFFVSHRLIGQTNPYSQPGQRSNRLRTRTDIGKGHRTLIAEIHEEHRGLFSF